MSGRARSKDNRGSGFRALSRGGHDWDDNFEGSNEREGESGGLVFDQCRD